MAVIQGKWHAQKCNMYSHINMQIKLPDKKSAKIMSKQTQENLKKHSRTEGKLGELLL
jgi:hypothetical protein